MHGTQADTSPISRANFKDTQLLLGRSNETKVEAREEKQNVLRKVKWNDKWEIGSDLKCMQKANLTVQNVQNGGWLRFTKYW